MLIPANALLKVYRTGTFETTIELFEDANKTIKWVLTNWTVELIIQGGVTLTEGSGLVVTKASGKIEVTLTAKQTEEMGEGQNYKYWLKISKTTGNKEVWFPLAGEIVSEVP